MDFPRLLIEQVTNHPLVTGFIEVEGWNLVLITTSYGEVLPAAPMDTERRRRLLVESREAETLRETEFPIATSLSTRTRYYDDLQVAVRADGMTGRPGHRMLYRSPTDRDPIDFDAPLPVKEAVELFDGLDKSLCRDEECDGKTHGWLRLELADRRLAVWHVNPRTGRVVPPQPMVMT